MGYLRTLPLSFATLKHCFAGWPSCIGLCELTVGPRAHRQGTCAALHHSNSGPVGSLVPIGCHAYWWRIRTIFRVDPTFPGSAVPGQCLSHSAQMVACCRHALSTRADREHLRATGAAR